MPEMPYLVFLRVGPDTPSGPQGSTTVDVTPASAAEQDVLDAIRESGLTAADLRTRALFVVSPSAGDEALMSYAAVCGFAGRRIDFTDLSDGVVDARSLHDAAASVSDLGKPDTPVDVVQVGVDHPDENVVSFPHLDAVTPEQVTQIRYARQARLARGDRGIKDSLTLLVATAGLRHRVGGDRFPLLVQGTEPVELVDETLQATGLDLDSVRRAAAELRRSVRLDDRSCVAPAVERTERQAMLAAAAAVDPSKVMPLLGSYLDQETGFWRCPRPGRHRNGDANPSTRILDGLVRCFRCDSEPVDSLRLVVDCTGNAPDDAARWLLAVDAASPAQEHVPVEASNV